MFVAKIVLEVIAVLLLAYGFYHEDKIAEWEQKKIRQIRRGRKKARQPKPTSRGKAN